MWPKVLAQLIELLPHASRLVPLAEKFFQGRGAVALDEDSRKVIDDLRAELGRGAAAQESMYRQMNEQSAQVADALNETRGAREAISVLERRLAETEKCGRSNSVFLVALLILVVVLLVLNIVQLIVRH